MKNRLIQNTLRGVKKAPGRFIAISTIAAISCAFYAGVKATCPDMKNAAWDYYEDYSLADIAIKSNLGFCDDDAEKLMETGRFDKGYAGYSADLLIDSANGQAPVRVMSWTAEQPLNKVMLVEGRLPEKSGECLADADAGAKADFSVGSTVVLKADEGDDIADSLDVTEFTVVGTVKSPIYVSYDRGSTTIGNGTLSAFIYIPEEDFSYDVFTDIYLSVKAAHADSVKPFSDEYDDIIEAAVSFAEIYSEDGIARRCDEIRADVDEELADAREKLADGEKKLADGQKEYNDGLDKYNKARDEYDSGRSDYDNAMGDVEEQFAEIEKGEQKYKELEGTCVLLDKIIADYTDSYEKVLSDATLDVLRGVQRTYNMCDVEAEVQMLVATYVITDPEKDPNGKEVARLAIESLNDSVRSAAQRELWVLSAKKEAIEEAAEGFGDSEEMFADAEKELDNAKKKLDEAKQKLDDAQAEIDDAKAEISDAEEEVEEKLADGEWYVWDRGEFTPASMNYGVDAERVDSIAAVFPVFFIIIAALVCCTTMSRMVEEQRTEAGTMKALGYSSASIITQYLLYALFAGLIGSVIGVIIGFPLLPNVIFSAYETMYRMPYFSTPFMPGLAAACIIVSVMCVVLSAVFTAAGELRNVPAALIRPKPPKSGKRIMLENMGFIWKRMKFTSKVSFRNLFRYKSRLLMTVIGIGGCTALLLTAFGLKEAIACIVERQYGELFIYDGIAVISDKADEDDKAALFDTVAADSRITEYMTAVQDTHTVSSDVSSEKPESYIFAPDTLDGFDKYIRLHERVSGRKIFLSEGAVISEKLSNMLGVGVGDQITIDGAKEPVTVSAVTENYTFHYIYMTREEYARVMGEKESNILLINTDGTPEKAVRDEISSKLIAEDAVISASFMYDGADSFRKLVRSLNLIVIVLIAFAGALAFVILFNLANISINERERELATIKVLGFFDGEVGAYIYRENTVSAIMGMAVGLFVGIFFERFVVQTAEVNEVMFSPDIPWFCFILAAVTMAFFTVLVNALLYFKLKKIDMAASMKAIE